jgi:GT2 family glycosyltransferase/glycosyltransferase involved in cell wall biosynthesis
MKISLKTSRIKSANANFLSGHYELALSEYTAIALAYPALARSLDESIRRCYRRLGNTIGSLSANKISDTRRSTISGKCFRVRFSPDYSTSNPYQRLLYSDCPPEFSIFPGDLTEAHQDLVSGEFSSVCFHLHWISPVFGRAGSVEEAEQNIADFLAQLNQFIQKGGHFVWTIHNIFEHDSEYTELELRFRVELIKLAKVIHVHSKSALAQIAEQYPLPAEKVVVQLHGHYINAYPNVVTRQMARAFLGLRQDEIVFLSLGQIRPYKGIETLLQAFSSFQRLEPRARLVIAGKPTYPFSASFLQHFLRGYRGVTLKLENIPDTELQFYFNAADAAVFTYRRILTSGSVLLAESFGVPCIGPDVAGLNDIICHGQNGFLYDPEDSPDSLQACFKAVAASSGTEREKLNTSARADAVQRSWTGAVKNLFTPCVPISLQSTLQLWTTRYINTEQLSVSCQVIKRHKKESENYLVGIVILNYENAEDSIELIRSIYDMKRKDLKIVVVDNSSPNLSLTDLDTAFPQCDIIRTNANLGYAAGNNVGIQYLNEFKTRYIWILNPDTVLQSKTLDNLLDVAERETRPTIWGSLITYYDRPKTIWFAGGYVQLGQKSHIGHLYHNRDINELSKLAPYDVDYITGAAIFCRSEIFALNGMLPEYYFLYFEETDWCQEAKKRGIQIKINPQSQLFHKKRSENPSGLPKDYYFYYFIRGAILFRRKYAQVPLDYSITEINVTFIKPWLLRIEQNHPDHYPYFLRLSQVAIQDGRNGVGGRRDLNDLSSASVMKQVSEANNINLAAQINQGNIIKGNLSVHKWEQVPSIDVVIDGRVVGHLDYLKKPESAEVDKLELQPKSHFFEFTIPGMVIDGDIHKIELFREGNRLLWQNTSELKISPPSYKGRIDGIINRVLRGWCIDSANPQFPQTVILWCGTQIIGICKADRARPDLFSAGFGTKVGGFEFLLPLRYCNGGTYEITLNTKESDKQLFRRAICVDVSKVPSLEGVDDENAMENWFFINRELSFALKQNACSPWVKQLEGRAKLLASVLKKKPQQSLVSVIMPIFNREEILEQALQSVVAQSYRSWELLVIDDGSKDQSVSLIRRLIVEMKIEDRVKILEKKQNEGVSAARNFGLAHAKGHLIAYLDSDNTWDQDFLLIMVNELNRLGNYACVFCGDRIKQIYPQIKEGEENSEIIGIRYGRLHRTLLENKNYIDLNVFMHTRDLYDDFGGFNENMRRLVDWELIVRYAQTTNVGFVPAILATYIFGASDNQITATEDYHKNALLIYSCIKKLHETRTQFAKKMNDLNNIKLKNIDNVSIFIYTTQKVDKFKLEMSCANWLNAFSCSDTKVTVLLDGCCDSNPGRELNLNNQFNVQIIAEPKYEWLSIIKESEILEQNNHGDSWIVLTHVDVLPDQDFQATLIQETAHNEKAEFIVPACMQSNSYALKSAEIQFRNSLHEFNYDFQPLITPLELSASKNPLKGFYSTLSAKFDTMIIKNRNLKDLESLITIQKFDLESPSESNFFEIKSEEIESNVFYSQNLRVHKL